MAPLHMQTERTAPAVSVVVPVFNEEESVDLLCEKLHASLSKLGRSYEIVLVDDGSADRTWEKLVANAEADNQLFFNARFADSDDLAKLFMVAYEGRAVDW